jgi:protocatechuate 3,4-dioxygenase beta subunit
MKDDLSRRSALGRLASVAALPHLTRAHAADAAGTPAAIAQQQGVCVLFPQAVEGPYYFDPKLVRTDISEGRPGMPLSLQLRIIESGPCTPIASARVDIWHADAGGIYSGYSGQGDVRDVSTKGQTYLRGTQITDTDGRVTFASIYPGWYPGRTTHIHIKVFLDQKSLVTGQVYFPEELSARIYQTREPYKARPVPDTINSTDWIYKDGAREGGGTVFSANEDGDSIVAALLIAVDTSGMAAKKAAGWTGWLRGLMVRE